jgi:hypothetical protein
MADLQHTHPYMRFVLMRLLHRLAVWASRRPMLDLTRIYP